MPRSKKTVATNKRQGALEAVWYSGDIMKPDRLEAFSDGVMSIVITIAALELHIPHSTSYAELAPLVTSFLIYALSFIAIATYWINHHHLVHCAKRITTGILWANMHLLFWLSLIPFLIGYVGENAMNGISVPLYGFVAFMCAFAYFLLDIAVRREVAIDRGITLRQSPAFEQFIKNYFALCIYALAFVMSFFFRYLALVLVAIPVIMYFVPHEPDEITEAW